MLATRTECIFFLDATSIREAITLLEGCIVVGFDGEDTEILTCNIETRDGPRVESTTLISLQKGGDYLFPALVHVAPSRLDFATRVLSFFCAEQHARELMECREDLDPGRRFLLVQLEIGVVLEPIAQIGLQGVGVGTAIEVVETRRIMLRRLW